MKTSDIEQSLRSVSQLNQSAKTISRGIHKQVLDGGKPTRRLADFLHGVWIGHPLHPILTDVVIGAWAFGSLLDLTGSKKSRKAADQLIEIGTAAAIPTALAGVADFSTISQKVMATGAAHGLLNTIAFVLFSLSVFLRRRGSRGAGVFLSAMGLGLVGVSGWLGGELSYRYGVGVNKAEDPSGPDEWTNVMPEGELVESQSRRVEVEGYPVLLYRYGGTVYAIGAVCAHESGPLEEGDFEGTCVTCPWHQSVFDLRDGSVVHGPSTYPVPNYAARIYDGQIQIQLETGEQSNG